MLPFALTTANILRGRRIQTALFSILLCGIPFGAEIRAAVAGASGAQVIFVTSPSPGDLAFPGCGREPKTGEYFHMAVLGIPSGASPHASLVSADWEPIQDYAPALMPNGGICRIKETGWVRNQRIASVVFFPYRMENGRLLRARRAIVAIQWDGYAAKTMAGAGTESPLYESRLKAMLANYDQARAFRSVLPAAKIQDGAAPGTLRAKIQVSKEGMVRVSYQDLSNAGLGLSGINPNSFRLHCRGREQPIWVEGASDGRFDPQDGIVFFGTFAHGEDSYYSPYTFTNVYWLSWGGPMGLRFAAQSGSPLFDPALKQYGNFVPQAPPFLDTVHVEFDNDVRFLGSVAAFDTTLLDTSLSPSTDIWYWGIIGRKDQTTFSFKVPSPLSASRASGYTARLRAGLSGLSSGRHTMRILLAQQEMVTAGGGATLSWDGQTPAVFESNPFPNNDLGTGELDASFEKAGSAEIDMTALNWIDLIYWRDRKASDNLCRFKSGPDTATGWRRFRVTGFESPDLSLWDLAGRKLEGFYTEAQGDSGYSIVFDDSLAGRHEYIAVARSSYLPADRVVLDTTGSLRSAQNAADLIILAHRSLMDSLAPLVELRERQGYRVKVVDVEEVYDEFNHGIFDPEAIKNFLRFAVAQWSRPGPSVLLIIGDTTHDFDKNRGNRNYVPTSLSTVPRWGPAANDDGLATICGEDPFPDLVVGRIPVNDPVQLGAVVGKIVANETHPRRLRWRDEVLLIGGFEPHFTRINERINDDIIRGAFHANRVETDPLSPYYGRDSHSRLVTALDAGATVVSFSGHGGGSVWSDGEIFTIEDIKELHNGDRLPFVFSFTCLTGFFESAFYPSLGEEMLRAQNQGALSFYGAAAYVNPDADERLGYEVMSQAVESRPPRLGEIVYNAELNLLLKYGSAMSVITRQYNLLGDPLSAMNWTPADLEMSSPLRHLAQEETLHVFGRIPRIPGGYLRLGLYSGNELLQTRTLAFSGDTFAVDFAMKAGALIPNGQVRAYAWNDTADSKGVLTFSKNLFRIGRMTTQPAAPAWGESLLVFVSTFEHPSDSILSVTCQYGIGGDGIHTAYQDAAMTRDNDTLYSSGPLVLAQPVASVNPVVWVRFRIASADAQVFHSQAQSLRMSQLPDLAFGPSRPLYLAGEESLAVVVRFLNTGLVSASSFTVRMLLEGGSDTASYEETFSATIKPGAMDSVAFPIPGSQGPAKAVILLNADSLLHEARLDNNSLSKAFEINRMRLTDTTDTLFSLDGNASVTPKTSLGSAALVSLVQADTADLASASQGMQFLPLANSGGPAYHAQAWGNGSDVLNLTLNLDAARLPADSLHGNLGIYRWSDTIHRWIWKGGTFLDAHLVLTTAAFSKFCAGQKIDVTGPRIEFSCHGQPMVFTDFIPIGYPIDFFIRDDAGVDISTIEVFVNGETPDSARLAYGYPGTTPMVLSGSYLPPGGRGVDSIMVRVADVNGNYSTLRVAYQLGDELSIRFLANYPNPFADKTEIAFSLTDACQEAGLQIFTMAGRPIRSWNLIEMFGGNLIGYHEVTWDGKDSHGYQAANGTYYVKLKVRGATGKREKIATAFRVRGFKLN